jgi:hypothetical protein
LQRRQRREPGHLIRQDEHRPPFAGHAGISQLQAFRIGMTRLGEQLPRRRALDQASGIEHRHLVAEVGGKTQIMRDEHQGRAGARLQLGDQPNDTRLDRDVERGRRLVGDNEPRIAGEGHGDEYTLAHATRELMGIFAQDVGTLAQMDRIEQRQRPFAALAACRDAQAAEMLVELRADGTGRIKRRQRLLRYESNIIAEQRTASRRRQAEKILAVEAQ